MLVSPCWSTWYRRTSQVFTSCLSTPRNVTACVWSHFFIICCFSEETYVGCNTFVNIYCLYKFSLLAEHITWVRMRTSHLWHRMCAPQIHDVLSPLRFQLPAGLLLSATVFVQLSSFSIRSNGNSFTKKKSSSQQSPARLLLSCSCWSRKSSWHCYLV